MSAWGTLDGTSRSRYSSASSGTLSLTTTQPNDVIIFHGMSNGGPFTGVSSVPALTWTKRGAGGNGSNHVIEEWFAIAATPGTYVITATTTTANELDLGAKAFPGANIANPFDGACVHGSTGSLPITTTKSDTLIIAASSGGAVPCTSGFTVDSAFNLIEQWAWFTSPQSALALTVTGVPNGMIADALVKGGVGPGGTVYVSPTGLDTNDGSSGSPVKTLEHARSLVTGVPGANIRLAAGKYRNPVTPLTLGAGDSGATWQTDVPNAAAVISGAKPLNGWALVSDAPTLARLNPAARGQVMSTTLASNGIAISDVGVMSIRGFAVSATSHAELSFNGAIQELARWPDKATGYAATASPINNASPYSFGFTKPYPKQAWAAETDIWAYGYWNVDYADAYLHVSSFNDTTNVATIASMGPQNFGIVSGRRVYFVNILAELSVPGEWYIDRTAGVVYFWPPAAITTDSVELSIAVNCLTTSSVSNLTMQGIIMEGCRGNGFNIPDGDNNWLKGCVIRNVGNSAGFIGSTNSGALGCDVHDPGDGGIAITAGDRPTLTSGGQVVDACHFSYFSRWCRTYTPAVSPTGVGWKVTRNLIEHAPGSAIKPWGNNGVILWNEFNDVMTGSSDNGVIYTGGSASQRGNQASYNYFHDIVGTGDTPSTVAQPSCIYFDNMGCGWTAFGNVFERVKRAFQIGGGDDNIVTYNTFKDMRGDCCIAIDSRGLSWDSGQVAGIKAEVHTLPYTTPPWSTQYPTLVNIDTDNFGMPKRNVATNNIQYGSVPMFKDTMDASAEPYNTLTPNTVIATTTFDVGLPVGDPNRALLPA